MDFEENNQAQPTAPDNNSDQGESFEEMLEASFDYAPPRRGEIRKATILQIEPNEIIVDLGAKQDGLVTSQDLERLTREFRSALEIGQEVPVYVLNPRDSDGNLVVSINMGLQQYDWDEAHKLMDNDEVVEVVVSGYNRGGILVRWHMLEGFIPSSHMVTISAGLQGNERREALNELIGEEVGVKVIEVDQDRRRLIFSEREAQREWRAQQKARLLSTLNEGDVVHGTVTGLRDFGAFVNLGGADGLIHVSELAWHRVDHPRDVLRVGQEIDVYVLNLDLDRNRIALSRKRLLPDPWDSALEQYHEGMQVEGVVTNVVDFGAFIALDDGLEGLLHLSEMGDGTLKEPYSYVKKGDRLQLRISRLEPEQRRVGFTQRWGTEQPILARADEDEEEALGEEFEEADADEIAAGADVEPEAAIEPGDEEPVEAEEEPVEEDEPLDEEPAAAEADVEPADEEPVEAVEAEEEPVEEDEPLDEESAAAEADVELADEEPVEAVEAEEEPAEEDEPVDEESAAAEADVEPADEEPVEAEEAPVEEDEPLDEEPAAAEEPVEVEEESDEDDDSDDDDDDDDDND